MGVRHFPLRTNALTIAFYSRRFLPIKIRGGWGVAFCVTFAGGRSWSGGKDKECADEVHGRPNLLWGTLSMTVGVSSSS